MRNYNSMPNCNYNSCSCNSCNCDCNQEQHSCGQPACKPDCPDGECVDRVSQKPIAMAYVPWQKFCGVYEPEQGLMAGTIFEELDKPFLGRRGCPK